MPREITRSSGDILDVTTVSNPGISEYFINAHSDGDDNPFGLFESLHGFLDGKHARIVRQDVFGSCSLYEDGMKALEQSLGEVSWPVTWIEGDSSTSARIIGTQVHAMAGREIRPLETSQGIVGSMCEDDNAIYCYLGGIHSTDRLAERGAQARETLEKIENCLAGAGMDFTNVVRTWLYVDSILAWYDELNQVRTRFFEERGVFEGLVPASTGIGVRNPMNTAVVADVIAIKPKNHGVSVKEVESPLQCSAEDYRSSFSRAVETTIGGRQTLYVSGTASIGPGGKTEHIGHAAGQVSLTMDVVRQILESRGMGWADVSRAAAYFRNMGDVPAFHEYCRKGDLTELPAVIAHADICRDDLLFEIEVDAIR